MKKNVLILCGGRSDEHEISLISAKCVLDAIDRSRFHPILVGIGRDGAWYLEGEDTFYNGLFRADEIKLNTDAPLVGIQPFLTEKGRGRLLVAGTEGIDFDIAFPILHGQFGEDGTIQGLFETIGIPYVGSDPGGSWICMDKVLTKSICQTKDIRMADFVAVNQIDELAGQAKKIQRLGLPLFVKPSRQGSSVGVSKVTQWQDLEKAVANALKYDKQCLVEKGINGREIETAILGLNQTARVALPGEIVPSAKIGWYSYEAKYLMTDGAEVVVPASLQPELIHRIQEFVLKIFQVLQCDGMARIDLFLEHGTNDIYLNEVNTIPGFTPISMYPKMWQASGLSYQELITELLELGFQRSLPRV